MAQLALSFVVVVAALVAMSTYVRRTYQARIYDTNALMIGQVVNVFNAPILMEYEPYYINTSAKKGTYENRAITTRTGAYVRSQGDRSVVDLTSEQTPPYQAR